MTYYVNKDGAKLPPLVTWCQQIRRVT